MSMTSISMPGMKVPPEEILKIEIDLLLEAIYRRYGYDFRDYKRETIDRRITQFQVDYSLTSITELIGRLLREPTLFYIFISYFSVNVTSLFRDPFVYVSLIKHVVPLLRTWPHIKMWDAGCATGEEAYSLAIMLYEERLLKRTTIYATDINVSALETAKNSIYSLNIIQQGSKNYLNSGMKASLSDYYRAEGEAAVLDTRFRNKIIFARHNLAMDASFGEMQIVICRNVLIYFNSDLQDHVLEMFWESLDNGGFLCLGDKETLAFSSVANKFEVIDQDSRIYKKRNP